MAKVRTKGTIIKQTISSVLTAVAQVISIEHSGAKVETYDATTLDTSGAGREKKATGYADGGNISMELFLDPALSGHQAITDDITTPTERAWQITFADSSTTTMNFTVAGTGFGFSVQQADGLKANVDLELNQLATYPT